MTAATGFKRLGIAAAVVVTAICGVAVFVSLLIPADYVREAAKAQIKAVTGLEPVLRGATSVSLFPSGRISFGDVALGEESAGAPALLAESLTARLRFFPLLSGRIEIADIALVNPRITVALQPGGRSNWSGLLQSLTQALHPTSTRDGSQLSFSEIRITDGTVVIRDDERGVAEMLTDIDMSLAWPSISRSFGATGSFIWRGEPVEASVTLGNFVALLAGQSSGLKIRLSGALLKAAFDGTIGVRPTVKIDGTFAADADSLRNALLWGGQRPLPGGGFGRFAVKAQTNVVGGTIAMSGVNLELDGNTVEGVLTFATDGRQTLQGTLAAETLDLSPYISTIRLVTGNDREWSRVPISLDGLTGMDFDIRLSAGQVTVSSAKLGRTAVATDLRNGKLTVTVGESQAFGGVIKGSFALARSDKGSDLKSQMQFTNVDLEQTIGELFGIRRLEGRGNLAFTIEATGDSVLALTRNMNGTATLTSAQGALVGLNVEQLLRRLERRPLSGGNEFRTGRTPFDKLTMSIRIAQGTAAVDDVRIDGTAVKLALAGSASIPARNLDLKGIASLMGKSAASTFDLPFVVQGSWDDPILLPDPRTLIRRSGAAAPLLPPDAAAAQ